MELSIEERTLVATYRTLDDFSKQELLRYATKQHRGEAGEGGTSHEQQGHCRLERGEERPEIAAEPIFTE